jgi:hypothetical protein
VKFARSTLADANETRDWRIYAEFAQMLVPPSITITLLCAIHIASTPNRARLSDDAAPGHQQPRKHSSKMSVMH